MLIQNKRNVDASIVMNNVICNVDASIVINNVIFSFSWCKQA